MASQGWVIVGVGFELGDDSEIGGGGEPGNIGSYQWISLRG